MYNDDRTPLDKATGAISILSDPTEKRMKEIAKLYSIPYPVIRNLLTPVNLNGRIIYLTKEKAANIKQTKKARTQWSLMKSRDLKGHLPGTVTNKKHARQTDSNHVHTEDPKRLVMTQKVVGQLHESKKDHVNQAWEKLTSH